MEKANNYCPKTVRIRVPIQQFKGWMTEYLQQHLTLQNPQNLSVKKATKLLEQSFQSALRRKYASSGEIYLEQYPILSLEATGKWHDPDLGTVVYVRANSKRRAYCRKWFIPANPRTSRQVQQRTLFKQVSSQWKQEQETVKNAWRMAANNFPATNGHNLYVQKCFEYYRVNQVCPGTGFIP